MIGSWALTLAAMRGFRVKVPQGRVAVSGAPASFSPVVGICEALSSAQPAWPDPAAAVMPSAVALSATIRFFFIRFMVVLPICVCRYWLMASCFPS